MFVFQDVGWITIRDVHLKSLIIAVVWEEEGSQMFPSLDSALSALHLPSSPPVLQMSLCWYGLLSVHSPLTWDIRGMLWYQCQARRMCWEGNAAPVLMTTFSRELCCRLVNATSNSQQFWLGFLPWAWRNGKICEASSGHKAWAVGSNVLMLQKMISSVNFQRRVVS